MKKFKLTIYDNFYGYSQVVFTKTINESEISEHHKALKESWWFEDLTMEIVPIQD